MNGLEVATWLHESSIGVQILVLRAYGDPRYFKGMLQNEASGYPIKDDVPFFIPPPRL